MFGEKLLTYKANRLARKRTGKLCSVPYVQAKNVGIIFTVGDLTKHNQVKKFIKKLSTDNKKVDVIAFLPKGQENHEFIFSFFTEKEISFWGNYQNEDLLKFIQKDFDFLFCLDCNPHPLLEAILAMTRSNCRVGCFMPGKDHFYEMMIHPKEITVENLANEMFRYIKILS